MSRAHELLQSPPASIPWSDAANRVRTNSLRPAGGTSGRGVISLALGEPDFPTPDLITEAMKQALSDGFTHYADSNGDPELREALASEVPGPAGRYSTEEVAITHGGSAGLAAVFLSLINPGDRVVIPQPTYSLYNDLAQLAGAVPVYVPLSETMHLDLDAISSELKTARMVVLCNPGNPTGAVIPPEQLQSLGDLLAGTNTLVLVDEAYADLTYDERFVSAASIPTLRDRLILCNTFSKSFAMTGWRIGSVLAPESAAKAIRAVHRTFNGGVNAAVQRAALVAVRHRKELVLPQIEEYRRRRDVLAGLLSESPSLSFRRPAGAFYLFARYARPEPSVQMTRLMAQNGVLVRAGREYGPAGEGHIRLSFASDIGALTEGAERVLQVLEGRGV